ncbi:AcrR family transcriptional regulator [Anoxybacillus calidus]|jgi:AcrR family transcriptional regulator|uniref:AcrR family transcriptional regulator n=1 Tax=[Anoxybacillus] calidus TaxID=575178 RepID=A0A7V9Z2B9_9BACL|nr:TetR/AcrR family transcriptional regulator [Anoxybacillus calidus]MBA2872791.1 AcrR family transcriptional regulator [Anoxybacillus calidus]
MNRQKHKEKIRGLLQQKALELFKSQGYHQTTIMQITESAGLAKGTFFNYFRTKEEILYAINDWHIRLIETEIQHLSTTSSLTDQFYTLLRKLASITEELGQEFTKSFFHISITGNGKQKNENNYTQMLMNTFSPLFAQGQASGEFRDDLPTDIIASTFSHVYFGTLYYWCTNTASPPLKELLEKTFMIFFNGIRKN